MRNPRSIGVLLCASVLGASWLPLATTSAESMAERKRAASRMVAAALQNEIEGTDAEREALLRSALEKAPDCAPAHWHSGYVWQRKQWVKFDETPKLVATDKRLIAYRKVRDRYPETIAGQFELAEWCAKKKLTDQQRVHLTNVLQINPDHAQARGLLGYRRVNGEWRTAEEIAEVDKSAKQAAKASRKWRPKLIKIRKGLEQRSQRQREAATDRLLAIGDPAAIGAMESVLSSHNEKAVLLVIQTLEKMPAPEASMSLARQALFSSSSQVRKAAAEGLRSRDMFSYVPALLSAMGSPVQSRAQLYTAPSGRLVYRHTFVRPGQQQNEVAVVETEYRNRVLSSDAPDRIAASRDELARQRQRDAAIKARTLEVAKAQQNAAIGQLNERICQVLSVATGQNLPTNPDLWWKWWNDQNEVYYEGAKPVKVAYRREEVSFDDPYPRGPGETMLRPFPTTPRSVHECLVAGTPVWTELGFVPIENIRAGDRVLSQNPETGELGYKAVLRMTRRPAGPLVQIDADETSIRCSGGHPFWISGKGWVKARELQDGTHLHRVSGTLPVRSVEQSGPERTYNLIVADFHTYFVDKAMILSHDNTIRQSTARLVPGLAVR